MIPYKGWSLDFPFLFVGDLNTHHPLWADNTVHPRGAILTSLVEKKEQGMLNIGNNTYFHRQTGTFSNIDLSLCSASIDLDFRWNVLSALYGRVGRESKESRKKKRWTWEKRRRNILKKA